MIIAIKRRHELKPAVVDVHRATSSTRRRTRWPRARRAASRTRRPPASPASARRAARPVRPPRRRPLRAPSAARLRVLQHRRLVRADFFGAGHPLIDRDRQLDAELRRHRFGLGHDLAHELRRHRGWRTSSSSVPPVSALIGLNATLPSSLTQISWRMRVVIGQRNPAAISASAMARARSDARPVRLAEADPIAFGVTDDAGLARCRSRNTPAIRRRGAARWRRRSRRPGRRVRAAARRARRRGPGNTTTGCRSAC